MRRLHRLLVVLLPVVAIAVASPVAMATMPGANLVDVELDEWVIRMPETIPAGETVFMVGNVGDVVHKLRVRGQGIDEALSADLQPGETARLEVDLEPGTETVQVSVNVTWRQQ